MIRVLASLALSLFALSASAVEISTDNLGSPIAVHTSPDGYSLLILSGKCVMNGEEQQGARPIILQTKEGKAALGCVGKTADGRIVVIMPIDGADRVFDISNLPFQAVKNI